MTTSTWAWSIVHTDKVDRHGRPLARVLEYQEGTYDDPLERWMPSVVAEAYVRARRAFRYREMTGKGHVKLFN